MASTNSVNGAQESAHVTVEEFLQPSYDYLIRGGGTAGLTIAARLAENPNVTVGVIEAGKNKLGDPFVDVLAFHLQTLGNQDYDWAFHTSPQVGNKNKIHYVPRGKLLGGSSGINYLYARGSHEDYGDWAELANDPSWSAAETKQYMRKHQTLEPFDDRITDRTTMPIVQEYHGTSGPIRTSFNDYRMPIEDDVMKAAELTSGFTKKPTDSWSGDHIGFFTTLGTVARTGPNKGQRSYAARGYFQANQHRPNLKVITESLVIRVLLENKAATGVEFVNNGQKHTVKANREVIVAGGAIQSPQILELSGIGDPEVLNRAGVECLVELPTVGTNYQDRVLIGTVYLLADGQISADAIHKPEVMAAAQKALVEEQGGPLTCIQPIQGFLPVSIAPEDGEMDEIIKSIESTTPVTPFQKKQWNQESLNGAADQTKLIPPPADVNGPYAITLDMCLPYPVSRGHVHITSSDPTACPEVNPNYLHHAADVTVLAAGLKFLEKVAQAPALKDKLTKCVYPEPDQFPLDTIEQRREACREYCLGEYHSCGTCAMGSTVDSRLKVYGLQNLRVADASIFPNSVSGNIVSSVYMVAEKAEGTHCDLTSTRGTGDGARSKELGQ
ncbi:uncharacterized protein Z518_08780 [Rhinocladiella mackenziei CBS 650.93]|uniref:Glucose-methanol-choline oxidoreductase N-terminal domain-containing protein n=1 Tax=Rhinocladiella mackenziei CBS 650.93 TaxID=1442369 RepID=A0A0D2FLG9_9EURO|nr:uncharacterized protein Z518_08780 [Rhinocladiella mackenziei CBS 650.93]KIX02837.1 hypothetical protein Z518_08780 [Rhinocladiella mackenziei CBS 650.93]